MWPGLYCPAQPPGSGAQLGHQAESLLQVVGQQRGYLLVSGYEGG